MPNLFTIHRRLREDPSSLPHVDKAALRHQVIDGVPAFIGEPDIDLDGLANLSVNTQEGFALLAATFPDQSPTELRALVQQRQQDASGRGARSESTYTICSAVEDLAALAIFRDRMAAQYCPSMPLLPKQLPTVLQYLSHLAAAAAADVTFVVPGTPAKQSASAEVLDTLQQSAGSGSSGDSGSVAEVVDDSGICELCGDPTPERQLAACSRGHAVCSLCLRQYICYTHGLQAGLESLKCLAFAADGFGADEAVVAPLTEHRCPGSYSHAHLAAALKPTELLQLSLVDARREARVAAARMVPFGCTACKYKGSIGVATIREALATTVRTRRMTGCGFRRRWVTVGVASLPCPGPGCKARYCPRCGGAEHTGTLCSPDTQDAKLMEWAARKKKAVQRCPQCYRLIEKGGGCKYMQCPKPLGGCGHEFCWQCREPFLGLHHCGKLPQDYEE